MKCISKINKLNKIAKEKRLSKFIAHNRQARLLRKEQAENKKKIKINGKKAEKVILDKLTKVLPETHKINDNNDISIFSRMDFTYYIGNKPITDIEHKYRIDYKHNHFYNGLMYGKNKYDYGLKRLEEGISHRIYWTCSDGIYFWELTDLELQKDEYSFGPNCNKEIGQKESQMVYVKTKYLQQLL